MLCLRGHPPSKPIFHTNSIGKTKLYQSYMNTPKNLEKNFFLKIFFQNWLFSEILHSILDHVQHRTPPPFFKIEHRFFGNTISSPLEKICRREILIFFSISEKIEFSQKNSKKPHFWTYLTP